MSLPSRYSDSDSSTKSYLANMSNDSLNVFKPPERVRLDSRGGAGRAGRVVQMAVDWVELGTDAAAFALGFPLNALTLPRLLRRYARRPSSLGILHIHLSISDLMVAD